jgi:hypothetical protein
MRLLGLALGSLFVVVSTVSVACKTSDSAGGGGAGGDDTSWTTSSGSASVSGTGGGGVSLCAQACAKVIECGTPTCPPEYLDCSMPSALNECRGQCALDANCAQILSIPTANPDPDLVACAEACGQSTSSSVSSSSSSSSSSSTSGAGGADAGPCSTCSAHLMSVPSDPACPASAPLVDALLACACQSNCPNECATICATGGGQASQACAVCAQTYCGPQVNACLAD